MCNHWEVGVNAERRQKSVEFRRNRVGPDVLFYTYYASPRAVKRDAAEQKVHRVSCAEDPSACAHVRVLAYYD